MQIRLTDRALEALKPSSKRYEVHDTVCPGLTVRVSKSGRKTFNAKYRYGLKQRRRTLGVYRPNEVRGFMRPLSMVASEMEVAILVVRHLRKASSESAIQRGQGSMDFIASVRSGLMVVPHPADPDTRVLAHSKANYSRKGPSLTFHVKGDDRDATPTIEWLASIDLSADQLLEGAPKKSAEESAADLIRELIASAPMKAREAMDRLKSAGFSERTIDRAKVLAGVKAGRGPGAMWKQG